MHTNLCRICLNKSASLSVFDKQNGIQYSTKIMRCVNVMIAEGDGLPDSICRNCAEELSTSYEFVNKCEASDKALRAANISDYYVDISTELPIKIEDIKYELKQNDQLHQEPEQEHFDDFLLNSPDHNKFKKRRRKYIKSNKIMKVDRRKMRPKMGPIGCKLCGKMFTCRSALENHMRTHTGEKPFVCDICDSRFNLKGSLQRHITTHHMKRERKFICETCGKSFYSKSAIITHIRVHTDEKPYSCLYCGKTFRQIASLIRHKRLHTGEKPFSCPICPKQFADKSHMRRHLCVHSDEKNFTCHLCSKSVKSRNALTIHLRIHSNERHNICNFCGMAFSMKGNLQMHIRRKHSEKSGECNICQKSFSDIEAHLRKHTGEKPYVCKLCESSFALQRSLSNHIRFRHQNISKFKCGIGECLKTFPTATMLEFHLLKQHTKHTPFICHHCSRGFFRSCDLTKHLKGSHMDTSIKIPIKTYNS